MYYKVTLVRRHIIKGKVREKEESALFTTEQAAKKFEAQAWQDKSVISTDLQGGYDSKGDKV